ncbi:FkbM family methyltransferase [Brunnivagina elsteri]|uniref:Methyltransferase FkbM domain-containing protein n=1 Tax=Brunnivagina elsteri CCALA 953 TaxID=987040 RepID=A0A2A2THJ8_9CYAN|nr:FkbM family methyltransferase [Calothrix elsteri]PAX53161.1 hypothetical protein CK510_15430 [Calothrix elsteri CCALA 953]
MKNILKIIEDKFSQAYIQAGYPLLPITKFIREPMRWYFHLSPLLRHDTKIYLKPYLLERLHSLLVKEHPQDFFIYHQQIKFRSFGSIMSIQAYYIGELEYHLVQYVQEQICPNFVMLDIGAHHGAYSLIAAFELKKRGYKGVIHSFEPDPNNFSLLQYNIKQNELEDYIVLHNCAVGSHNCQEKLVIYPDNSGNFLASNPDTIDSIEKEENSIEVEVIKLDDYLINLSTVTLIKMDIQGAEPLALLGAKELIKQYQPIIVTEAMQHLQSTEEVKNILLHQYSYTICGVKTNGELSPLDSPEIFVSWDWVALPQKTNVISSLQQLESSKQGKIKKNLAKKKSFGLSSKRSVGK